MSAVLLVPSPGSGWLSHPHGCIASPSSSSPCSPASAPSSSGAVRLELITESISSSFSSPKRSSDCRAQFRAVGNGPRVHVNRCHVNVCLGSSGNFKCKHSLDSRLRTASRTRNAYLVNHCKECHHRRRTQISNVVDFRFSQRLLPLLHKYNVPRGSENALESRGGICAGVERRTFQRTPTRRSKHAPVAFGCIPAVQTH
jgi:hypothetical protein